MIELRNVGIRAGKFSLDEISFEIGRGQYAVLMGETGQGKTTILEAICGLRSVHAGQVVLRGQVSNWLDPADRNIGYVPQDLVLFPNLNVRQQIEFALNLRKSTMQQKAKRVTELAELLGIVDLLPRRVDRLSGGESQRVALGRALSFKPDILLLDEPFAALDEKTRSKMLNLIQDVQDQTGVTILQVTHRRDEAELLADQCLVLADHLIKSNDVPRNGS